MLIKMIIASLFVVAIAYFGRNTNTIRVDELFTQIETVYFFNESFLFEDKLNEPYMNSFNTLDKLINGSDEVYRILPISREQYGYNFLTKCVVLDSFKNSEIISNEITISETAYIEQSNNHDLKIMGFLTPMKYDQEYVVFIRKNEGFTNSYYVQTSNIFGIVPIKDSLDIYDQWNQKITLNKSIIEEKDLVYDPSVSSSNMYKSYVNDYIELHSEVMKIYFK